MFMDYNQKSNSYIMCNTEHFSRQLKPTYPIKINRTNPAVKRAPLLDGDSMPSIAIKMVIRDMPKSWTPAPTRDTKSMICIT